MSTPTPPDYIYLYYRDWWNRLGHLEFFDDVYMEETATTSDCDEADLIAAHLALEDDMHREEVSRLCEARELELNAEYVRFEDDILFAVQNDLEFQPFDRHHVRMMYNIYVRYDALIREKRAIRKERRSFIISTGREPVEA